MDDRGGINIANVEGEKLYGEWRRGSSTEGSGEPRGPEGYETARASLARESMGGAYLKRGGGMERRREEEGGGRDERKRESRKEEGWWREGE